MSSAANPRHPDNPPSSGPQESTGTVTSDSLAAESLNSGGSFADGAAAPQSVPSHASTASNTDTSGATRLPPAYNAADRLPEEPEMGLGGDQGAHKAYDSSRGGPQESYGGTAPASMSSGGVGPSGHGVPKGKNITEGGFDSDAPNASFNNEIGTKNDPGRLGEQEALAKNAREGFDAGYEGANDGAGGAGGKGGFESLRSETDA